MAKFLKNIALFSLIPIIALLVSDAYLRNKNSLYKEKFNGAVENSEDIKILILGNSHANYGVDPTAFQKFAYNIANVNQSFYFDKRITLKLLDSLKNLEYVLISADYHSLSFSDQGIRNKWSYLGNGVRYKNEDYFLEKLSPTLFAYPPKVLASFLKRDVVNVIKYKGGATDYLVQKGVNPSDSLRQGFIGYTGADSLSFSLMKYKERAELFNREVSLSRERKEIRTDLENFISILKSRNITPILYTTPTFEKYNKFLNKKYLNSQFSIYREIAQKKHIKFWNFMNSDLFPKIFFYNPDHLNKKGAKRFAKILNDSIQKKH